MNKIETRVEMRELTLRDPFGISRGTKRSVQNLFVKIGEGRGEGAPIYYRNQSAPEMQSLAEEWLAGPLAGRPIEEAVEDLLRRYPNQTGLAQAVDLALHDAWGKAEGKPLYRLWNLEWETVPLSSFTIGMDSRETVLQKVDRAAEYPILKIKVGNADDLETLQAIHDRCGKPLLVDANEAWTEEQALARLPLLDQLNVRLLEQPLPRADRDGYARIRQNNPTAIPLFVDEGLYGPEDIPNWIGCVDGINIKLAKCGGLSRARRMIEMAREHGLRILIGCMIESSVGITAAAHLAPLADFLDLDGAALLAEDPFEGMRLVEGRIVMPDRPGIGAVPKPPA